MTLTLPQRLYLLGYDLDKGKLDLASSTSRGRLLRAAACAQLSLGGQLSDRRARAVRTGVAPPVDPFLAAVHDDVPADKALAWAGVMLLRVHEAEPTVREQLVGNGTITVADRKAFGIIPAHDVTVADPDRLRALREQVRAAALGGLAPESVPAEDAVLAVLALIGTVATVFGMRESFRHGKQLTALRARVDELVPGIPPATQAAVSAARVGGTA